MVFVSMDPKDCCPGEGGCSTGPDFYIDGQLYCRKHCPTVA